MPNVLDVVRSTTAYFSRHGIESPRLNAEHLIAHALKMRRLDLYLEFDRPLSEGELAPMRELVRRRAIGIPLQHLLGTVEFFGRTFGSDARALIPRPETEQLVEIVLECVGISPASAARRRKPATEGATPASRRILDIGTGSGAIAITLALELPEAHVHASDISPDALVLARMNAGRHGVAARIAFHEADLIPPACGASFDIIVANLPYIPDRELPNLAREVRHDPAIALAGGGDGLDVIRRLVAVSPKFLTPSGWLVLEVGHDQAHQTTDLCRISGFVEVTVRIDFQGIERFVVARLAQ